MNEETAHDSSPREGLGSRFWRLTSAVAISNVADGVMLVAIAWAATTLTTDPFLVSAVTAANRLPWVIMVLPFGVIIDRIDRSRAMAYAGAVRSGALAILAWATMTDNLSVYALILASLIVGATEVVFDTSAETVVPSLVPAPKLHRANGHIRSVEIVGNDFLGRPVGGFLLRVGLAVPFIATALGSALAAVLAWSLREPQRSVGRAHGGPSKAEMIRGLAFVWQTSILRVLMLTVALLNGVLSALIATQVLFVHQVVGLGSAGFGILLAVASIGAVLGSQLSSQLVASLTARRALPLALMMIAGGYLLIAALPRSVVAVTAGYSLVAGLITLFSVASLTIRQRVTPDDVLGRVNSVMRFATFGASLIGMVLGGAVVSLLETYVGLELALIVQYYFSSVIFMVVAVALARSLHSLDDSLN